MATIRSLSLSVTAKTEKFQKGMKAARLGLHKFVSKIPGANLLLNKFSLALGGAAAVIGSTIWVKNTLAAVDATAKFADRIGMTVEGLQTLQHAATLTGVGVSSLQMGLQRMTRRVAEAAQGTGEAKGALKELGLNARELAQMRPEQMFSKIAGSMTKVAAQGDRVRLAMKLFDSEGVAMVNTLAMGEEGLEALNKKLARTGLLFSRADAGRIEEANDAIANLKLTVQAVANLTVSALAPAIRSVTDGLRNWVEGKGSFRNKLFGVLSGVAEWIDAILNTMDQAILSLDVLVKQVAMAVEGSKAMFGGGNVNTYAGMLSDLAGARTRRDNFAPTTVTRDFIEQMRKGKEVLVDLAGMKHVKWDESINRARVQAGGVGGTTLMGLMDLVDRTESIRDRGGPRNEVEREMLEVLKGIYQKVGQPATAR